MRWVLALLILTGTAFAESSGPSSSDVKPRSQLQSESTGGQRTGAAETPSPQQNSTERDQKTNTERWSIIIGAGAVGGAFLQALIFIVMISTSRRQLRAYVFVETKDDDIPVINGGGGTDGDKRTVIPLHIVNRGQTPAYRLHFWITTNVLADPFPLKTPKPTKPTFTYIDLGPNQPIPMFGILDRAWTPAETNHLVTQKGQIYVWGTIFYRDTFSRTPWRRWRRTEFRLMVPVQADGRVHGIMFCENGNKAT
jgi:hypothetical protein